MKKLLLLDANALIHRMYHALPNLTDKEGNPAGSLYGLSSVLIKIMKDINPDYAIALFDRPEKTFRKKEFDAYKANRPKTPDELIWQIICAHDVFESFSIKTLEKAGYEADDLIGTIAEQFKKNKDLKITIFTGDLDALQLVDDGRVVVETFKKGISETKIYNNEEVFERLGVPPEKVVDYKAFVGDASDNIPGVRGIGPKATARILLKYSSIEDYFENGADDKDYQKIKPNEKIALMSKRLATIVRDVPIEVTLDQMLYAPNLNKVCEYFSNMGFDSLIKRLPIENETEKIDDNKNITLETNQQIEIEKDLKDIILLDEDIKISKEDILSKKTKVGYELKDFYKKHKFIAPFVDIKIGFELLGKQFDTYENLSKILFTKIYPKKEFLLLAYKELLSQIKKLEIENVFWNIEMPLIPILASMEQNGVCVDESYLKTLQKKIEGEVKKIKLNITNKIGTDININSPQQLLKYFNENLNLKLKSTSAEKLEPLKEDNQIIRDILEYRTLFKLKTTYVDAYTHLIEEDGKIHPKFLQLGASTGRLSCQNPNLQNIPQESFWSKEIRNVFSAPNGWSLASFDYSQIELRILASLSMDEQMVKAFKEGKDIHRITAHNIFEISEDEVTNQQRRIAKTLNFGIIYGMGQRSLAKQSGMTTEEAKEFINKYFEKFSMIKKWQGKILEYAHLNSKVVNINGRFRYLPSINSMNPRYSSEAERMAINMPLQSVAADIIKLAMIEVDKKIKENKLTNKIKMILTIHDELIFEINDELLDKDKESKIIKNISEWMNGVIKLEVNLKTEPKIGKKWGEIK